MAMLIFFYDVASSENLSMLLGGILTACLGSVYNFYRKSFFELKAHEEREKAHALRKELADKEMRTAQAIQETLLGNKETVPGLDIACYYKSAEKTGGDWFGYYPDEKSGFCFIFCGDVTGHGFSASLMTGLASGAIKYHIEKLRDNSLKQISYCPEEELLYLVKTLNTIILKTGSQQGKTMTLLLLCLNIHNGELYFCNAGHNFPILSSQNKTKLIPLRGSRLGFSAKSNNWKIKKLQLSPGDTFITYTDGLMENTDNNGHVLSQRKLKEIIQDNFDLPAQEILDSILNLSSAFLNDHPMEDDCTISVYKWSGSEIIRKTA